jgi:putative lipoprotein (rSAM/lipoprotein system)
VLLGIVGLFTSCKPEVNCNFDNHTFNSAVSDSLVVMYGMPIAYYEIRGTVLDKENSKPIPDIRIISPIHANYADTLYTDAVGKYAYSNFLSNTKQNIHLKVEDIDGHFATKEIDIKINEAETTKINECFHDGGRYIKVQNIELKRKK